MSCDDSNIKINQISEAHLELVLGGIKIITDVASFLINFKLGLAGSDLFVELLKQFTTSKLSLGSHIRL